MASVYEVNAKLAVAAERRSDALAATVRWCLAAEAAHSDTERVGALGAARRNAELALHQAAWAARSRDRDLRPSWRALAAAAGVPFQTFHRRYRHTPVRISPGRGTVNGKDVERSD
jgi:hypothetical protein